MSISIRSGLNNYGKGAIAQEFMTILGKIVKYTSLLKKKNNRNFPKYHIYSILKKRTPIMFLPKAFTFLRRGLIHGSLHAYWIFCGFHCSSNLTIQVNTSPLFMAQSTKFLGVPLRSSPCLSSRLINEHLIPLGLKLAQVSKSKRKATRSLGFMEKPMSCFIKLECMSSQSPTDHVAYFSLFPSNKLSYLSFYVFQICHRKVSLCLCLWWPLNKLFYFMFLFKAANNVWYK